MTNDELILSLLIRNTKLNQRLCAAVAALEAHRLTEVEQMLYTSTADTEQITIDLRVLKEQLHQLSLFP
jgi:hypothetical protein